MLSYAVNVSSTSLNGLIRHCGLTGKTSASTTNINEKRTNNPIIFSESDRWCSAGSSDKYKPMTWKIIFNKEIFITNYSIKTNLDYSYQFKWIAKGKSRRGWVDISTVTSQTLGVNTIETWPTNNHGPFSAFEITTTENGLDVGNNLYSFCFHKIEFYGIISHFYVTCLQRRKQTNLLTYMIIFIS